MSLPIIRPDLRFDDVADDLRAVIDSGILTNGPRVESFERAVADIVGVRHAISTTSATTALHLALAVLGVGPGDEVLVSDFTFPATGNVVAQIGARPVLVDCAPDQFTMDVDAAASLVTARTRAILAVDPFGRPADLDALVQLARRHDLGLVEDAACALGAARDGRACGSWPSAGCFSFHPRKVVTTGEGGMVTTDDDQLAAAARRLRNHGGRAGRVGMVFEEHGFNYRLSEVAAVLGSSQLRRLDEILDDRRRTAARYDHLLEDVEAVRVDLEPPGERWAYQSYVVQLDDRVDRDAVVERLRELGIETTLGTYSMHAHPVFERWGYRPGDLPHAHRAQQQSLTLPLLPRMEVSEVERVVDALRGALATAPTSR